MTVKTIYNGITLKPVSVDPSAPVEGQLQVSDGTHRPKGLWIYKDAAWSEAGGSGGGGLDVFAIEDFETTSATSLTSGNDADYLGGGSRVGVLSDETSSPLSKDQSVKYTQATGSLNDYVQLISVPLDDKQKGRYAKASLVATYDGDDDDIKLIIVDNTGTRLDGLIWDIQNSTLVQPYENVFYIPENATSLSLGVQVNVENDGAILIIDDIEFSLNTHTQKGITTSEQIHIVQLANAMTDRDSEVEFNLGTATITGSATGFTVADDAPNTRTTITVNREGLYTISFTGNVQASRSNAIAVNGVILTHGGGDSAHTQYGGYASLRRKLIVGDVITFGPTSLAGAFGGALTSEAVQVHLNIVGEYLEDHVITSARSSETVEKILPVNVTTTGDVTALQFDNLIIGQKYFLSGYIEVGGTSADYIKAYSGSSASGTLYGNVLGTSNPQGSPPALFFTAVSSNLYIRFETVSGTLRGNGTKNSNGTYLQLTNVTAQFLAAIPKRKIAILEDIKAAGVAGGTSTANTIHTRTLNTVRGDTEIASLSTNQFTLQKGVYTLNASAPAYTANRHQLFLYNITDSSYVEGFDSPSQISGAAGVQTDATLKGKLTLLNAKTFEIRHWFQSGKATDGLGVEMSMGVNPTTREVYTRVVIEKLE